MANKYTAKPAPPKEDLERLYYKDNKTQTEIAVVYGVTQKMVFGWFRRLGIKSRVAAKRNQRGQNNSSWKGDKATYAAYHYRVKSSRGKADHCEVCGRSDNQVKYDWANLSGRYDDIDDYMMMCRPCHFKRDGHRNNLPNRRVAPKNVNKRKLIDGKY